MRFLPLLAASVLCASLPDAQTRITTSGPLVHATYELDSGRVELASGFADASTLCFDNTIDPDGAFDALLYPAGDEILDWGVKSCGGSSFVDQVEIAFSSMAVPVFQGGPGGSLTLRIYAGSTGNGHPGQLVKTISLSGLPSIVSPIVQATAMKIQLGSESFFLPDGPLGWSYENPDGNTAPLLVDFDASTGTENAYDVYRPAPATPASYAGTFTLPAGGLSNDPKENSLWFRIYENDVPAAASIVQAGTNPDLFRTPAPPIVGHVWHAFVDLSSVASNGVTLVALATGRASGVQTPFGELVVDPETLLTEVSVGVRDGHRFPFPPDASMLGMQLWAQGGYFDPAGELHLTNGLDLTVGSF